MDAHKTIVSEEKKSAKMSGTKRKRAKKRSEMSIEELTSVRLSDKAKKQRRRLNLTEDKKEEIRRKDRDRKKENKEQEKICSLLRMRKMRLVQSDEKKESQRQQARDGMRMHRKEGPVRKFKERNKKHEWAVKWKKYLSKNPEISQLEDKKKKKKKKMD